MQFLQLAQHAAGGRSRLRGQRHAHPGQHGGVGAIGLRQLAGGFGEAPRLAWIDFGERQSSRCQGLLQGTVIGAGRLKDDPGDRCLRKPADQLLMAAAVIIETRALAAWQAANLKTVF